MITLNNVCLQQGTFVLQGISLDIPENAYAILTGETGCGKTTLLEAICGLRRIYHGSILLADRDVTHQEPSARQIGYVPQDAALFPSMRVDQQIAFGLDVRKQARNDRNQRVEQLAELLGLKDILKRYPRHLSGGERQRVALARAIAFRPELLCMDEPLCALDEQKRVEMSELLRSVHEKENVTVLHVTHNSAEARELGTIHFHFTDGKVTSSKHWK